MSLLTVQERARWLDKCDVKNPNRKIVLDQPISEDGLLGTGTSYLKAEWKKTQEEDEALKACLPRKTAPPPPPPPPRAFGGQRPNAFPPRSTSGTRRPFTQPPRQQRPDQRESRDPSRDRQGPPSRGASSSPMRGGQRGGRRPFGNKRPRQ